jgi:ABC-2 type transport system permease protein
MDMEKYSVFLFSGLLPWMYLQTVVSTNTMAIVGNSGLIKKIYFPREILPLSATVAGAINYLLCLSALVVAMIFYKAEFTINMLYFPLILAIQMILIQGLSLAFSALNVFFRDITHIVNILFMAWFYLTPIFYPIDMVPEKFRNWFELNPMTKIEQSYQSIFYYGNAPSYNGLLVSFIYAVIIYILGYCIFNWLDKKFAEEL